MAEKIKVGEIYIGKVLKIKPFGAIVMLPGNMPGLVHISQIADGYVQDVGDVLGMGDEVKVKVLSYDEAAGKIALSMKGLRQPYDADESYDTDESYETDNEAIPAPPVITPAAAASFEEKFKAWQKSSNERIAGINRRNKRR